MPRTSARGAGLAAIQVRAAALIDASTGQVLYGIHAGDELAIASTTKLMTALVTLEHARLWPGVHGAANLPPGGGLADRAAPGERMSVHDLLLALLLPSADDAAEDLAYNVGTARSRASSR